MDSIASPVTPNRQRSRLAQGNLVVSGSSSQTAIYNPMTQSDVFPRPAMSGSATNTPVKSEFGYSTSPDKPKQNPDLSLSDDDSPDSKSRVNRSPKKCPEPERNVVLVDALSQRVEAAEVPITESLIKSHAKVVCHSPQNAARVLMSSGVSSPAAQVSVDRLKSVVFEHNPSKQTNSPDRRVVRTESLSLNDKKRSRFQHTAEDFGIEQIKEDALSIDQITEVLSSHRQHVQEQEQTTEKQEDVKPDQTKKSSTKTNKTQTSKRTTVSNRLYRSTASSRNRVPLKENQSANNKSTTKTSSKHKTITTTVVTQKQEPAKKNPSNISRITKKAAAPGMISKVEKKDRKTSTPEKDKTMAADETMDISALSACKGLPRFLNDAESFVAPSKSSSLNKTKNTTRLKSGKRSEVCITQDSLDLQYSRYLQYLFLSSKTERTVKQEEKEATRQLGSLSMENSRLRNKLNSLTQENDRLEHVTMLDEALLTQKTSLSPIVHELPMLSQYYKSMSQALDTTRHELPMHGIYLPTSDQDKIQYQDGMMKSLNESEQLLSAITSKVRRNTSTTGQYAQTVEQITNTLTGQDHELKQTEKVIDKAQELSSHENFLIAHQIELDEMRETV